MPRALALVLLVSLLRPSTSRAQDPAGTDRTPDVNFVATPTALVSGMLDLAAVAEGDVVYDLGSGDGRIVIAAARRGARAVGVELEASLVAERRGRADSAGVEDRAEFRRADIFATDLREATVVTLYLGSALNRRLRPILLRDLRPGSRVVSQAFDMGDWRPDSVVVVRARDFAATPVHLWVIPARVAGDWDLTIGEGAEAPERLRLTLTQRYQELEGSATSSSGTAPLRDLRLRGGSLGFTLGPRRYRGQVSGRMASGTLSAPGHRDLPWRAVRAGAR